MELEEFEGKDIDEAIDRARERFCVSREKLNIEIISPGSAGFLGIIGAKKALIKAGLIDLALSLDVEKKEEGSFPRGRQSQAPGSDPDCTSVSSKAKEILEGILRNMELDCEVAVNEDKAGIVLSVTGDGGGLLIGKRGQTLDALQYLVNKALYRSEGGRMIIVDVEDYRRRREENLSLLALDLAKKVKKTRKSVSLSPMNSSGRRIIHLALQDDAEIVTRSSGEGEFKKVIIMPARRGKARQPNPAFSGEARSKEARS